MSSKFCINCGTVTEPGKAFCSGCGARIDVETGNPVPQQTGTHQHQPQPQPVYTQQPGAYQPQPQPVYTQQPGAYQPQPQPVYTQQPGVYQSQPGYAQQPVYANTQIANVPKKKTGLKIALIIIGCFVAFIVLIVVIASSALGGQADADSYKLGNDEISSVKAIVGRREISSYETKTYTGGVTVKTITYKDVEDVQQDLMEYITHLRFNEGFSVTVAYDLSLSSDSFQLAKPSVDGGMVILLDVEYSKTGFTLVFTKGEGTFESYG